MGLTRLKEVYERRLHQQAFIFVAEELWPQLLEIETELDEEVLRPAMQEDEAEWKKYCSCVIYVMQKLGLDEAERLKQATKLAPIAWREFEPISDNEMDTAGIKPASDRHASETKKAQRPGRKIST